MRTASGLSADPCLFDLFILSEYEPHVEAAG